MAFVAERPRNRKGDHPASPYSPEGSSREGGAKHAREALLDAAEDLIIELGAASVSLDKVAARAGMSKGGLLYHFPSKRLLVQALIQRFVDSFEEARVAEQGTNPRDAVLVIRSHLRWWSDLEPRKRRLHTALLAAVAHDPKLIAPFASEHCAELRTYEAAGIPPGRVAVIMMALHGLWFLELLGITPLEEEHRQAFMQELFQLAEKPVGFTEEKA